MRARAFLWFFFAASLPAQTPLALLDLYQPIVEYLELSPAQLEAVQAASLRYSGEYYRLYERQDELTDLIFEETAKSDLLPSELGRLHAEKENNRRRMAELQQQSRRATRSVLTPAQRTKLDLLEQIPQLREPASVAASLDLLVDECTTKFEISGSLVVYLGLPITCEPPQLPWLSSLPEFGPARPGDDPLPDGALRYDPHLVRYLDLTPEQRERIEANQRLAFDGEQIDRILTLSKEIREETAQPEIDTLGLGIRYAEIETRRRAMGESLRQLSARNLALLTPPQRLKYDALVEAVRLRETIDEAQRTHLMDMRCKQQVFLSFNPQERLGFDLFNVYLGDCVDSRALEELPR